MSVVLEINNLTKRYGNFTAVNDLSLTISNGNVFGILGPNGSGKTTTLGMILDVLNVSSGSYSWFGEEQGANHRKRIGAILEHPIFYPELSGLKNLEITALIKEVDASRIESVLKRVDLWERKDSPFNTYSLGMKQRLSLAAALLSDPEVLVLDEPTNGLDPEGIRQMRELILSIASEGKTIIISSHILDEIQKMCTHFGILRKGRLLMQGAIEDILTSKTVTITAFDSGKYEIPSVPVEIEEDGKRDTIYSNVLDLIVTSPIIDTTKTIAPIKDIFQEPLFFKEDILPILLINPLLTKRCDIKNASFSLEGMRNEATTLCVTQLYFTAANDGAS